MSLLPTTGEIILASVTLVGGSAGTVAVFWIQGFFDGRKERIKTVEDSVRDLGKEMRAGFDQLATVINNLRIAGDESHSQLTDKIAGVDRHSLTKLAEVNTRIEVLGVNLERYRSDITKVEGKLEQNTEMGAAHISALGHVTRQLDAVFRIVDAQERASDKGPSNKNG
jgi:hypothetical protein